MSIGGPHEVLPSHGRGHGFENMRAYAGRLGGRLIVEPRGSVGGASVTCVMPLARGEQEG